MRSSRYICLTQVSAVLLVLSAGCGQQPAKKTTTGGQNSPRLPKLAVNSPENPRFDDSPKNESRQADERSRMRPTSEDEPSDRPAGSQADHASHRGQLFVALDNRTVMDEPLPADVERHWQSELRSLSDGRRPLIKLVDDLSEVDWLVQVAALERTDIVYLRPAGETLDQSDDEDSLLMLPPKQPAALKGQLEDIARAFNLIELAKQDRENRDNPIKLDVELRRLADGEDQSGTRLDTDSGLVLRDGALIGLKVRNPNRFPVGITVFFVDSHFHVHALFPREGQSAHLAPRAEGDTFMPVRATVNADAKGFERFVVLAVKEDPDAESSDFTFLAETERPTEPGRQTPLQQLAMAAVYRAGGGKSADRRELLRSAEDHAFRIFSWRTDDEDETSRGVGFVHKGPADDFKAEIVNEQSAAYHTLNRTQAVLGSYGKILSKGNALLGKSQQFEHRGLIEQVDRARRFTTVQRRGKNSGKDLLSFVGNRQAWQVVDLSAKLSAGGHQEVEFEIVGTRLDQSDVIRALNADREALTYFDYLRSKGETPCVVLENIVMANYSASHGSQFNLDANAKLAPTSDSLGGKYDRSRESSSQLVSPVIRCYQMYEVKQHQNQVVELVSRAP